MEEYLTKNNTIMSTVCGNAVEIFCMTIWLQRDVFVCTNYVWNKLLFKEFNQNKGRNIQIIRQFIFKMRPLIMNPS